VIAILIATKIEAHFFLKQLSPVKKDGVYHYRGMIGGRNAALYLTRPGVAAKEQLRRFLRLYNLDAVISTGTCANLTSELKRYDTVKISDVTASGKKNLTIAREGRTAVSVTHLIVDDNTKADLRAQTRADILDMETYTISAIMAEPDFARLPFSAVRVVDDLPGEENYLLKEKMLREMTATTPSGRMKLSDIWRFGIWDYFRITMRRHRIAHTIFAAVTNRL
jgi:nucleoside phosphorylase